MALIRPCADLRNNYNEISKICHETREPIYITRNGSNDLVVLSDEVYETIIKTKEKTDEERIDRLISEHFDKHYATFEEFQKDILKKIEQALKDVEEGRYQSMEDFCAEMEEKYDLS
ncbi:MAG: type II toxin-antitoxin system Phd/YefM family antitoxin [Clostridia bacterium]|nr:type II toxin-antitoxin system Phd/YefM family antitoxin [Clostridia bacterium]